MRWEVESKEQDEKLRKLNRLHLFFNKRVALTTAFRSFAPNKRVGGRRLLEPAALS